MTKIYFIDIILSIFGVFIYLFGLKKLLLDQPRTFQDWYIMKINNKGMPIEIGVRRLSFVKEKGLISEKFFPMLESIFLKAKLIFP